MLTLKGDFTLSGSTVEDMAELITMFLSGLTERSQYAVTLTEVDSRGQKSRIRIETYISHLAYYSC